MSKLRLLKVPFRVFWPVNASTCGRGGVVLGPCFALETPGGPSSCRRVRARVLTSPGVGSGRLEIILRRSQLGVCNPTRIVVGNFQGRFSTQNFPWLKTSREPIQEQARGMLAAFGRRLTRQSLGPLGQVEKFCNSWSN